jgi:membrane protease YdiL (CAAX protease family)
VALPSVGFGLWHLAPQSVSTGLGNPGGAVAFVGVATLFGLCLGWVAYRTGSIRWPVISHVLLDFAGLGGRVYPP